MENKRVCIIGWLIIISNLIIIWGLIPGLPGSFYVISLPMWALRLLNALGVVLAMSRKIVIDENIFIAYHLLLSFVPMILAVGLIKLNGISRKILITICGVNLLYWLWAPLALGIKFGFAGNFSRGLIDYGLAVVASLTYLFYLTDPRMRKLFK